MTAPAQPTLFDPLTDEQARAVGARPGSRLLHANAGSGKTTVVVERFVAAVVEDGVDPRHVLAITFTDKAAGELRQRLRERLAERGAGGAALAAEGAQVSTIHGFCAGLLRAHALAAGVDPGFRVLDEAEAARLRAAAFEAAFAAGLEAAAESGGEALELAAAYRPDRLYRLLDATYAQLRSRGHTRPALPAVAEPAGATEARARLQAARAAAAARLGGARDGALVERAREALEHCQRILAARGEDELPAPGELDAAGFAPGNAQALACDECAAYLEALAAYRQVAADARAARACALLGDLLAAYGAEYEMRKRARSGLDFDDLELAARDLLLAREDVRQAVAARYAAILVDEFQDTNLRQLQLLELLERDNLITVGDEHQSIYGFRHADVEIFRRRRARLQAGGAVDDLAVNFRSRGPILQALNAAFAPVFGPGFTPLRPGRADAHDRPGPLVELLVTGDAEWAPEAERLGDTLPAAPAGRRAEARLLARRVRELVDAGEARPGEVVILLRSSSSIRLFERALEDQGLPTYVAGGRGYWSTQQVHDLLAYLAALANPREELRLFELLASPLVGVSSDGLAILASARRQAGRDLWWTLEEGLPAQLPPDDAERLRSFCPWFAAERRAALRHGLDELIERAVIGRDYDLHVLGLLGGERRLANLRKLARLAREYERREGRDLRGFLDHAEVSARAEPAEGDAPVEAEGLDAVRLMTIHAAKGLEFGVVCVADLGRAGPGDHPDLLVDDDGRVGLRLVSLDGNGGFPALDYQALRDERAAAEEDEERRVIYVALTRARERLIASGTVPAAGAWPAPRPAGAPIAWLAPALAPGAADALSEERPEWESPAGVACRLNTPATVGRVLAAEALAPAGPAAATEPSPPAQPPPAPPAPPAGGAVRTLSYSGLEAYARCPYRFYLERVLRLAPVEPPPGSGGGEELPALLRGTLAHALLERLDFAHPEPADVAAVAAERGVPVGAAAARELAGLVARFAGSPLCRRLAAAAAGVRREAQFAFALDAPAGSVVVNGVVDVIAREGAATLIVDYKSDPLEPGEDPAAAAARDYPVQRLVYALAALRDGAERVEVVHCYLEQPDQPAAATFDAGDVARLERELGELAAGALAGEFPVTDRPHRGLCATCPGRAALCSYPEELTLRELEPAPG
jgi:ATP-dependent exoDNAse (exonuclease V) beta subunit